MPPSLWAVVPPCGQCTGAGRDGQPASRARTRGASPASGRRRRGLTAAFIGGADFSDPALVSPDWIVPLLGSSAFAPAGETTTGFGTLPAGQVGVICATGEWPDFTLADGQSFFVDD
jgi:hypothetical protein